MTNEEKPRTWGPQGVNDPQLHGFDSDTRKELLKGMKDAGLVVDDPTPLIEALECAASKYHALTLIGESSKPGVVRKGLRTALLTAQKLNDQVRALDGNSQSLANEAMRESAYAESDMRSLIEHSQRITNSLSGALHLSEQYPQSGNLPDAARLWLAVNTAEILATHLHIEPTTSREGPFELFLRLTLEVATGKEAREVHKLARTACAVKRKA